MMCLKPPFLFEVNVVAGIVFSAKVGNSPVLTLTNDKDDLVTLSSTKYYQGRIHPSLFGAHYKLCLAFPLNNAKSATRGKIDQQRMFLELYWKDEINHASLFGSSQFLITMLHGDKNVESIAYTEGHRLLLLNGNSKSKVFRDLTIIKAYSYSHILSFKARKSQSDSYIIRFLFFIFFIIYFHYSFLGRPK